MTKTTAIKLARSLARKGGFSELEYTFAARTNATTGKCELWMTRRPGAAPFTVVNGEHNGKPFASRKYTNPPRAFELLIGRGATWARASAMASTRLAGQRVVGEVA